MSYMHIQKLIGRLLCLVGWHDWRFGRAPKDALWLGFYRECKRCGLSEVVCYDGGWG